jgi:hypothetical protein
VTEAVAWDAVLRLVVWIAGAATALALVIACFAACAHGRR